MISISPAADQKRILPFRIIASVTPMPTLRPTVSATNCAPASSIPIEKGTSLNTIVNNRLIDSNKKALTATAPVSVIRLRMNKTSATPSA